MQKILAQEDADFKASVPTTTKMFLKQKLNVNSQKKVENLEKIVWEITMKFIKVDQEVKNIKEEVKPQDQTKVKGNEIIAKQEPTKSDMHNSCVASTVEDTSKEVELSEVENKTD